MKKKIIIIVSVLIGLGIIGAGIGFYFFKKPVKDFSQSSVDVSLTAKSIYTEFLKDQNSASAKYVTTDKTIEIKGKVSEIKKNDDGSYQINLDVGDPEGDVCCTLTMEESAKAGNIKSGDMVSIKGQCTGFQELISKEVVMIRCGISK